MLPTDRSDRLHELVFVTSLVQLMQAHPSFQRVDPQALRSSMREARVIPDITAERDGHRLVIECKAVAPSVRGRINSYLKQLDRLREAYEDATVILAIPEALQEEYQEAFTTQGYEVWDIARIANDFGAHRAAVTDPSFLQLLLTATQPKSEIHPARKLRRRLKGIPCGKEHWSEYQRICVDIFEYLFVPPLARALYELADEPRINRRDIVLPNYTDAGFWHYLRSKFTADHVVVDAKNYCKPIKKNEVLQVANYLKASGAGLFGIICCRTGVSPTARLIRREQWTLYGKMIVFLTDDDLTQMLALKQAGDEPEQVIRQKIEEFRLGL